MTNDHQNPEDPTRQPPQAAPSSPGSHDPTVAEPIPGYPSYTWQNAPQPDEPTHRVVPSEAPPDAPSEAAPPSPGASDPTIAEPIPGYPSYTWQSTPQPDEPTLAAVPSEPPSEAPPPSPGGNDPTVAEPIPGYPSYTWQNAPQPDEPTRPAAPDAVPPDAPPVAEPPLLSGYRDPAFAEPTIPQAGPEDATTSVVDESPTTTGPTVGDWPLDELLPPPPADLVWVADTPAPPPPRATHSPAYYLALGAAVVLVVGLVAAAALVTVIRPTREVAGTALAGGTVPEISTPSSAPAPSPTPSSPPRQGPLTAVAQHPLSASTTRMADATCSLPRFDPADAQQAAFYTAAKTCADSAWRGILTGANLNGDVKVVTVTSTVQTGCGDVTPTSPAIQCDGTVYMTPARLRDTEQNGRYPGRYLGVFLREYAHALQFTTGLSELVGAVTTGSAEDLDKRAAQQATCLAGVVSGAMAGRGAVDDNITGEISDRLTRTDAPADAKAWLDKGFQQRTPAACNTWAS